jgi:nucleoside-diphosphate-sugar epimerase
LNPRLPPGAIGLAGICQRRDNFSDTSVAMDMRVTESEILVTGAGGFIGSAVTRLLAADPGFSVRAATRDGRSLGAGVTACKLDVCDERDFAGSLKGVDAVVHCAVGARQTTVEGTRRLLQAAREAGVRRVVHLSSIAVYGEREGAVDEAVAVVSPEGQGYAHWKVAAEAACREAGQAGIEVVILRPAIVYGPGSPQWIVTPAKRLLGGHWGALGDVGRGTCNAVHVDDVAAACLAALRAPAAVAAGQVFNISGHEAVTWNEWYARLASALGCPPLRDVSAAGWRQRMLGALPFKAMGRVSPVAGRIFGARILSGPSPSELRLFALAATYPTEKAAAAIGWEPRIGLDEGLASAVACLRSAGLAR